MSPIDCAVVFYINVIAANFPFFLQMVLQQVEVEICFLYVIGLQSWIALDELDELSHHVDNAETGDGYVDGLVWVFGGLKANRSC